MEDKNQARYEGPLFNEEARARIGDGLLPLLKNEQDEYRAVEAVELALCGILTKYAVKAAERLVSLLIKKLGP